MKSDLAIPRSRKSGKGLLGAVVGVALLAVLGFAAYKILFNRPGEAAAMYIPADAGLVVTMDFAPSDRQAETFNKITQALDDQGIAEKLDTFLKTAFEKDPVGAELRPHLKRSFAVATWSVGGKDTTVALLAIDDAGAVRKVIEKTSKADSDGIYTLKALQKSSAAIIDSYLVMGNSADAIRRIQAVRNGKESSVASLPTFVEARSSLPKDANMMVFLSPTYLKELGKSPLLSGAQPFKGTEWLAYSTTVEPDGLAFDYFCPFDAKAVPGLAALSKSAPFSTDALKGLPQGAYGFIGISQAAVYWDWAHEAASSSKEVQTGFEQGIVEFEKQSGLSIQRDILPAFKGEQVLAVYPGPTGKGLDLDVVVLATNANGATPAALAEKLRAVVERESAKKGEAVKFTESKIGEITVWEIDKGSREKMVGEMFGAMNPPSRGMPDFQSPVIEVDASGVPKASPPNPSGIPKPAPPQEFKDKTVLCAAFPDKFVVTSSRALLNQMISGSQGGKSLADSPAFENLKGRVLDGSQSLMFVDLRKIMDTLRPTLEENMKGSPVKPDDLLNLFGDGKVGLVGSSVYDGKVTKGRLFLPLDWEHAIRMIGAGIKGFGGPDMGAMPDMSGGTGMMEK
jgi:hypothetical protein